MNPVFLDTVGLIAAWDKADQWHDDAEPVFLNLVKSDPKPYWSYWWDALGLSFTRAEAEFVWPLVEEVRGFYQRNAAEGLAVLFCWGCASRPRQLSRGRYAARRWST